jgi:EmrB/QacA subfamily drug resistance transporter
MSVISNALPTIVDDLGSSPAYAWIANSYFLTSTAFQPLYGQTANIFGRRSLTLLAVILFAVGSAVSGSATSIGALIAGRSIQGIGGGGINVLIEIIVSDLVPVRERPKYIAVIFSAFAIAGSIGPLVGGAFAQRATWRWIFYMNLPISGIALILLFLFLNVQYKKDSAKNMLRRTDFLGNALLVAAVVAILLALTWGGTEQPWSSSKTLVPLILGLVGLVAFIGVESTTWIPEPTMPIRLFANRTSLAAFAITFLQATIQYWIAYYLPVYFQAVLEATPIMSGVNLLPFVIAATPFAMVAGAAVSKLNRYRPWHFIGFGTLAIGYGMLTLLTQDSTTGYWVGAQIVLAVGTGVLVTTSLPAVQAPLHETDTAVSTATWGFLRSFGGVWGVAVPSAIFNSQVNALLYRISDQPALQEKLANGGAYALASKTFLESLNDVPELKSRVLSIYVDSLKLAWQVGIGFSLLGFVISFIIKEIPMREHLETEFGMETKDMKGQAEEEIRDVEHNAEESKQASSGEKD